MLVEQSLIADSHEFGIDPLSSQKRLMRQKAFDDSFRLDNIFHTLVNGHDTGLILVSELIMFVHNDIQSLLLLSVSNSVSIVL